MVKEIISNPRERSKRVLQGEVVSTKMQSSIVVQISSRKLHPLYKKYVNSTKKVMAHDPQEDAMMGDTVLIIESRPVSKRKRWELAAILKRLQ